MSSTSWKRKRRGWKAMSTRSAMPRPPGSSTHWRPRMVPKEMVPSPRWNRWKYRIKWQCVAVLTLVILTLFLQQTRLPVLRPMVSWFSQFMYHDTDFSAVRAWYQDYLGSSPSFLPVFGKPTTGNRGGEKQGIMPVDAAESTVTLAAVEVPFSAQHPRLRVRLMQPRQLLAPRQGKVLAVTLLSSGRYRVVFQHPQDWVSCYEGLTQVNVADQQILPARQSFGVAAHSLAVSVWHKGQPIDPKDGWLPFA